MFVRVFLFVLLVIFCVDASAMGNCTEPAEPACAASEETFNNKEAYAACAEELSKMSTLTKEYIVCMKDELKQKVEEVQKTADDATDKVNAVIRKFNCKADPKAAC